MPGLARNRPQSKTNMWKKIKENWKEYLLLLLTAIFGGQAVDYATIPDTTAPPLEEPAAYEAGANPNKTWTVAAYVYQLRKITGQAMPAYDFWDCLGKETIFVESWKAPTVEQIVAAYDPGLDPAKVKLKVVKVIPPERWKGEAPGEIPGNIPPDQ